MTGESPAQPVGRTQQTAEWIYSGLWSVLVNLFRVPDRNEPPTLPVHAGGTVENLRPADGYLRMQKFIFWVFLFWPMDVLIVGGWIAIMFVLPVLGIILLIPALILAIVPDIFAYVAIHLRYDTMWYVLSDRAIRIRRGAWIIHEMTISFENVQNVTVRQGPLQRYFGIADVVIDTAGGTVTHSKHGSHLHGNHGLIQGIADAPRIRDLILARLKQSKTAGLGDEEHDALHDNLHHAKNHDLHGMGAAAFTSEHIAVLHEIREELRMMNAA